MASISDLIGELSTRKVVFRGKEITLRAVTARTIGLLETACPRPVAPWIPDPNLGTGSGKTIANRNDARFVREDSEWRQKMVHAEIAMAMDLEPAGCRQSAHTISDPAAMKNWAEQAVAELGGVLTPIELLNLSAEVDAISAGSVEDAAKKG